MLVDDEQPIARAGELMLQRLGYQPAVFTDPEQALAVFREAPGDFAAIITDLTMPRLTGILLAQEIRGLRSDIPIILTTGFLATVNLEDARQSGVQEVVSKPFRTQDLAVILSRLIEQVRRQR
jgi:CheY-like chemotaxis protein